MDINHHSPDITFFNRARHEHESCGDQAEYWIVEDKIFLCLVDGLGHGEFAKEAAHEALSFVEQNLSLSLPDIFYNCDRAIRHTRGVAMAVAIVDQTENNIDFAGVGNIHGAVIGEINVRLSSHAGIVGGGFRQFETKIMPLSANGMIGLFTDGISPSVDMTKASSTAQPCLSVLANDIYKTWGLDSDDAGILICRSG